MLSDSAAGSEMLEYELETANDEFRKRGKPQILPVRIGSEKPLEGVTGAILQRLNHCVWHSPDDGKRLHQRDRHRPRGAAQTQIERDPFGACGRSRSTGFDVLHRAANRS